MASASLASSPWPTRSPEKLPRVSPPASLEGCGSTRRAEAEGLSPEALEAVEDAAEAIDSSITWPNSAFPFPPKENLPASFTCDIPAPCGTELKLGAPVAKEKPLLLVGSAELAGATDESGLDGWPNTKFPGEAVVLSAGTF